MLLTDIYLDYSYHLANGKINPKDLYNDWVLNSNVYTFNKYLDKSVEENKIIEGLNLYKPKHPVYKKLKTQLEKSKALVNQDSLKTIVKYGDKIRPNKSSDRIVNIRKRLNELGYLNDTLVNSSEVLDTILQESIKSFQKDRKLKTDAIVGKGTVNALNKSYKDQYHSVLANLERWRWFPRERGKEHILVNIADYNLSYITPKDTTYHKIIVGRTGRKTPVFSSQIKYLEFNPKWYIPPTIKNEDVIPAARKNTDYFKRKNISIYNRDGQKMHPDSINWNSDIASSYKYIQSSGKSNALGRVKIIFPNSFSVYLHDTSSKSLFKKNYRARSSGCVRVQNPFELSAKILRNKENWNRIKIDTILKRKSTKRVHIKDTVKVHFLYWSVVFNNDNQPQFINDVYDFDSKLAEELLAN